MPLLRTNGKFVIVGVPPEPFELHSFAVVFSEWCLLMLRLGAGLAVLMREWQAPSSVVRGCLPLLHACHLPHPAQWHTLTACMLICVAATCLQSASAWAAA